MVVRNPEQKGKWWLIDGRHRFAGAGLAGLQTVPAIERKVEETMGIILSSLVLRKHFTKGALAYIAFPLLAVRHIENGGDRKSASPEKTLIGQQSSNTTANPFSDPSAPFSAEILAEQ